MALYFIAILPSNDILDQIQEIKNEASVLFESYKALNSPPHVTLIPPFSTDKKNEVITFFKELKFNLKPFELRLANFDFFGKRTVFIKVENNPLLAKLHSQLENQFLKLSEVKQAKNSKHTFTPHVTILNRDITEDSFDKAWRKFRKTTYQARFIVLEIVLFRHEGKQWQKMASKSLS